MTDLRVITTKGSDAILEETAMQNFAAGLRGPLKNKYDPTNLFRLNQNIKPTL